jgi:hypothetical protein
LNEPAVLLTEIKKKSYFMVENFLLKRKHFIQFMLEINAKIINYIVYKEFNAYSLYLDKNFFLYTITIFKKATLLQFNLFSDLCVID